MRVSSGCEKKVGFEEPLAGPETARCVGLAGYPHSKN